MAPSQRPECGVPTAAPDGSSAAPGASLGSPSRAFGLCRAATPQLNRLRARRRRQKHAAWRISRLPVTLALMLFFSTGRSLWISGTLIIGGGTLLSTVGPALVRRYVALDRLTINNEIAGFKFATVGVLYAVLLAFVVIVVWEKFSDAEANAVREAGAAENLYRLSLGLGDFSGPDCAKPSPPISRRRWRTTSGHGE